MSVIQSWQESRTAEFSASPGPSGTVITAKGELDAANAGQLTEFVERALRESRQLIVDLTGLDFIATAGFSTLHRINVACSGAGAHWVLLPGPAVHRLLAVCDPDGTLPTTESLTEWSTVADSQAPLSGPGLLQLVPQPR